MEPETTDTARPAPYQLHNPAVWAVASPLLKWVGGNLASGIVGAAGGKIFTEVLSLIGLGGPDLAAKLDDISNQISEVQRSLDRLTTMTNEILAQLTELKEFMAKSLKQQELSAAIRRIDTVYGAPSGGPLLGEGNAAISLHMLTVTLPQTPGVTQAQLKEASASFTSYATEVPYAINTIHDILTDRAFGSESLLTYWGQEFIREIQKGRLTQEQACQILEGYFLQAVSTQLKGVSTHCVALGAQGAASEALVAQYLTETFAPKMRNQTSAFVAAVETILFTTTPSTMAVGGGYGMGELREFPRKVSEILLRTDLLAAALNLAGSKRPAGAVPLNEAIQGIYGRALYRPSDLQNGRPAPLGLQRYYRAQAGDRISQTPLRCISLSQPSAAAPSVLQDVSSSFATVAHYFWPIDLTNPGSGVGVPIDRNQRDGVVPALYPVFGSDGPLVMAACFLDVTRLYRSVPPQVAQLDTYRPFGNCGPHIAVKHQEMNRHRNPLTDHSDPVFWCKYEVHQAYKAEGYYGSSISYKLFGYQGAKARVRLTAHIQQVLWRGPRLDCGAGTAFAQEWNLIELMDVRRVGGPSQRFYDSRTAYQGTPMRLETYVSDFYYPFPRERSGAFSCTFDLEPGEYEFFYEQIAYFPEAPRKYSGWHTSGITFKVHKVTLELVP